MILTSSYSAEKVAFARKWQPEQEGFRIKMSIKKPAPLPSADPKGSSVKIFVKYGA
jgi:hypothetical protein